MTLGLTGEIFTDARIEALLFEGAQEVYNLLDNADAGYGLVEAQVTVSGDARRTAEPGDS
jgi:hypothetical protein